MKAGFQTRTETTSTSNLQFTEEHFTPWQYNQQNPDCGKFYRTNDQFLPQINFKVRKRKREGEGAYRLGKT